MVNVLIRNTDSNNAIEHFYKWEQYIREQKETIGAAKRKRIKAKQRKLKEYLDSLITETINNIQSDYFNTVKHDIKFQYEVVPMSIRDFLSFGMITA